MPKHRVVTALFRTQRREEVTSTQRDEQVQTTTPTNTPGIIQRNNSATDGDALMSSTSSAGICYLLLCDIYLILYESHV